jgi:hypothetical protein
MSERIMPLRNVSAKRILEVGLPHITAHTEH